MRRCRLPMVVRGLESRIGREGGDAQQETPMKRCERELELLLCHLHAVNRDPAD